MITNIVVLKITRAFFGKKEPIEIMIGFYDEQGRQVGSQLVAASLFDADIKEQQSVNFKSQLLIQELINNSLS